MFGNHPPVLFHTATISGSLRLGCCLATEKQQENAALQMCLFFEVFFLIKHTLTG